MKTATLLLVALLAGCASSDSAPSTIPTATLTPTATPTATQALPTPSGMNGTLVSLGESFDSSMSLPTGWAADAGNWSVEANASAPSQPNVLRGIGGGGRSTLRSPGAFLDVNVSVAFLMVSGDEGAGLSLRYTPTGDYRIVRYSMREAGWHYFIMKAGAADKRNEATVAQTTSTPEYGQWVNLTVVAQGKHIQAWADGTLVIDFTETEEPAAGAVGPFLRGSAVALFDDLDARAVG